MDKGVENKRLPMAITMGDASGVGPEIVLRRFAMGDLVDPVLVYGDVAILRAGMRLLGLDVPLHVVDEASVGLRDGYLNVVDLGILEAGQLTPGVLSADAGAAALAYVERATRDALACLVAGVVTMPMNKAATRLTTPDFVGHTEHIAALCGVECYAMMLASDAVAVAHVSTHLSLADAIHAVTRERIGEVIALTQAALERFLDAPRIAVCGLNPHAGEGGLFGDEEARIIVPAIEEARARGIAVDGPFAADAVFRQAIEEDRFDAIVAMYHDQGHAPMKLWNFEECVNVTIGLPILRASVDHGTAFDIAWRGTAFTHSLRAALNLAWRWTGLGDPAARADGADAAAHVSARP